MNSRAVVLLLTVLGTVPGTTLAAGADREQATLDLGAAARLPGCHDFSVKEYTGTSCKGTVEAALATALRSPAGFLLRPELRLGGGYDTDLVGAHYFDAEGPQGLQEVRFALGIGLGYAGAMPGGEVRIAAGPRLSVLDVPGSVRGQLEGVGFDVDPHGSVALGGEIHLELEWDAADKVRLGPRVHFAAGSEVFMMSGTECDDDPAWCDDVLLLASDVEMEVIVTFAMSLPSDGPVGFFLEAGPRLDITAYTPPQLQSLNERHYVMPGATVDVTPWIVVGAQFRLGDN